MGQYTSTGTHYVLTDIYLQYCPDALCFPPVYYGTALYQLGQTTGQAIVCVAQTSILDSAAVAVALNWPTGEPWERNVTMKCDSSGIVTYPFWSDSFGQFYGYPTNDPCKSYTLAADFPERAGELHSHPYFTTTEEYNRGNGCHGDKTPRSEAFLQSMNAANEDFSGYDVANGEPGVHYLKTPTGQVRRRNFESWSTPIYP